MKKNILIFISLAVLINILFEIQYYYSAIISFLFVYFSKMFYHTFFGVLCDNVSFTEINKGFSFQHFSNDKLYQVFEAKIFVNFDHYNVHGYFENELNLNETQLKFIFHEQLTRRKLYPLTKNKEKTLLIFQNKGVDFEVNFFHSVILL